MSIGSVIIFLIISSKYCLNHLPLRGDLRRQSTNMLLPHHGNRWYPASTSFRCLLRLSGRSFGVLCPKQRAQRQFSNRTPTNTHFCRTSEQERERRNSSVAAHPTSSSPNVEPIVRDPFTILFCGRDSFSCAVFREVYNTKGEFFPSPDTSETRKTWVHVHGRVWQVLFTHRIAGPLRLCVSYVLHTARHAWARDPANVPRKQTFGSAST